MTHTVYYIKPEAAIVCKICKQSRNVSAPHQRKRVFILGVNNSERLERINAELNHSQGWEIQNRPTGISDGAAQPSLSDTVRDGSGESWIPCKGSDGSESFSDGESWGSWPSRPGQPQHGWEPPRVVGNSKGWSNGQQQTEQQGWNTSGRSSEERGAMGDSNHGRLASSINAGRGTEADRGGQSDFEQAESRQAQPSLGGDSDGSTNRMDDAELFVTSDNRTDELRLLGNGVVPATATRAFIVLINQLLNQ